MAEEAETAPVEDEAPVTEAAPAEEEDSGAPATPPEGFIEQDRYDNLRAEHNRKQALWDRAQQGDLDAMRELRLPVDFGDDDGTDQEDEDAFEDGEVADPVAREWIQQQQVERTLTAFNSHLDKLAGDPAVLDEHDRQAILNASIANGFNEQATEDAFSAWKKREEAREKKAVERYLKSKKAPYVSPGGTGATEEVLPLDATHAQRAAHMAERLNLAQTD